MKNKLKPKPKSNIGVNCMSLKFMYIMQDINI